jgi:hypothetical protein
MNKINNNDVKRDLKLEVDQKILNQKEAFLQFKRNRQKLNSMEKIRHGLIKEKKLKELIS